MKLLMIVLSCLVFEVALSMDQTENDLKIVQKAKENFENKKWKAVGCLNNESCVKEDSIKFLYMLGAEDFFSNCISQNKLVDCSGGSLKKEENFKKYAEIVFDITRQAINEKTLKNKILTSSKEYFVDYDLSIKNEQYFFEKFEVAPTKLQKKIFDEYLKKDKEFAKTVKSVIFPKNFKPIIRDKKIKDDKEYWANCRPNLGCSVDFKSREIGQFVYRSNLERKLAPLNEIEFDKKLAEEILKNGIVFVQKIPLEVFKGKKIEKYSEVSKIKKSNNKPIKLVPSEFRFYLFKDDNMYVLEFSRDDIDEIKWGGRLFSIDVKSLANYFYVDRLYFR